MKRLIGPAMAALVAWPHAVAAADKPIKFWNLTAETIVEFYLAPAGTTHWSKNQCANDPDGSVDTDEMVAVTGIAPGRYDAKFKDTSGRTCIVKNLTVKAHAIFSIEEKQLKSCAK